jgi:hypothetical protein
MPKGNISFGLAGLEYGFFLDRHERNGEERLIHRETRKQFVDAISSSGRRQTQQALEGYGTAVVKGLEKGNTYDEWGSEQENPFSVRGFWDAVGVDTRFKRDIRLARLSATATNLTQAEVIRASVESNIDGTLKLWSFWDREASSSLRGVVGGSFNGSSWNNDNVVVYNSSAAETVCLDAIAASARGGEAGAIVVLLWSSNDHLVYRSTDGASYVASATPLTANRIDTLSAANADTNAGKLVEIGGELVAVVADQVSDTITFFSSTDAGNVWNQESAFHVPGTQVLGVAVYPGIDDADKLYMLSERGLFEIDTAPSTWTSLLVYPNSQVGDLVFSRRVTVWNDKLWFAPSVGNDDGAIVVTMNSAGGVREFRVGMGLNVNDGVPNDCLGAPRWLKPAGRFLYMSVGGHAASRQARIMCYADEGWHPGIYQNASADQEIEWLEFSSLGGTAAERLHFSIRTGASTVTTHYIADPNVNPAAGVALTYVVDGHLDLPYIDGGMPHTDAILLQHRINGVDLSSASSSGEYIEAKTGVDGAVRTGNDFGDFLSGTKKLEWTGGLGSGAREFGHRLELHRGPTNTKSPKLKSWEMDYIKIPETVEEFWFKINLQRTAEGLNRGVDEIIDDIETLRDATVMVTLRYGQLGVKYVRFSPISFDEDVMNVDGTAAEEIMSVDQADKDESIFRTGTVMVHCFEVIT